MEFLQALLPHTRISVVSLPAEATPSPPDAAAAASELAWAPSLRDVPAGEAPAGGGGGGELLAPKRGRNKQPREHEHWEPQAVPPQRNDAATWSEAVWAEAEWGDADWQAHARQPAPAHHGVSGKCNGKAARDGKGRRKGDARWQEAPKWQEVGVLQEESKWGGKGGEWEGAWQEKGAAQKWNGDWKGKGAGQWAPHW